MVEVPFDPGAITAGTPVTRSARTKLAHRKNTAWGLLVVDNRSGVKLTVTPNGDAGLAKPVGGDDVVTIEGKIEFYQVDAASNIGAGVVTVYETPYDEYGGDFVRAGPL